MDADKATGQVIEAIESAQVPYMLVGSFSTNAYGVFRSTKDADLVVSCPGEDIRRIMDFAGPAFQLDSQLQFETVTGTLRYVVDIVDSAFRIELFRLSKDPHDQERFRRRKNAFHAGLGRDVTLPTPEDVILTKLRWAMGAGRGKDREDVRDVIAVQGDELLDWRYIRHWTDQHGTSELLQEIRDSIPPLDD
jgi:hypothetical protein